MSQAPQGRVVGAHRIAAGAFRLTAVFVIWAAVWAVARLVSGVGSWWGPLHVFLVGGVLLAISGASQLFSITWAAATPPGARIVFLQRWVTAAGAAVAVLGVTRSWRAVAIAGASLVGLGLGLLGIILVGVFRRSLLRRFGLSGRFYILAIAAGIVGVTLGGILGVGGVGTGYLETRTAHMHLNLIGLIGFTIYGTLPTLLPTTARHRMVSGVEAVVAFWVCVAAGLAMTAGILLGPVAVGVGAALAAAAGITILAGIVVRLGARRMLQSSLPGLLITTGTVWIVGWCTHQAGVLLGGGHTLFSTAIVLGAGGVALVLFGSLAYLVPVLVAPGQALGDTFPVMHGHAAIRVIAANAVLALAGLGAPATVTATIAGIWLFDFVVRVGRVMWLGRRSGAGRATG